MQWYNRRIEHVNPNLEALNEVAEVDNAFPGRMTYLQGSPEDIAVRVEQRIQRWYGGFGANNYRPVDWRFGPNQPAAAQAERDWGTSPYLLQLEGGALYLPRVGGIYIGTQLYTWLSAHEIKRPGLRARGLRTLTHELFHSMRLTADSFYPFEEGAAELFANAVTQHLTLMDVSPASNPAYLRVQDGMHAIAQKARKKDHLHIWLLRSRTAANQLAWFEQELIKLKIKDRDISKILSYNKDPERWANDVLWALRER